jgi:acetyl-CoA carboxylase biotin carboxyl carrier protein
MDTKEIKELIKLISETNIAEFKVEKDGFELTIRSDSFFKGKYVERPAQQVMQYASPMPSAPVQQAASAPAEAAPSPAPAPSKGGEAKAEQSGNLLEVKSPMVGTFYRSPSPDKPVFVNVGDMIKAGDVVCIIEAMKLFNEIESEVSGKVVKVLVNDSNPVEYDQVLFLVDPAG